MTYIVLRDNSETEILCPNCTPPRRLIVKTNRFTAHQFLGCPNWPDCNYTRSVPESLLMRASGQKTLFDGSQP